MTEPTVSVAFAITTARGAYTIQEATLERDNLDTALKDIETKLAWIAAAEQAIASRGVED